MVHSRSSLVTEFVAGLLLTCREMRRRWRQPAGPWYAAMRVKRTLPGVTSCAAGAEFMRCVLFRGGGPLTTWPTAYVQMSDHPLS
ncbi:MAG: hypothetical protein IT340_15240 [Chloroflexi bacterium]|nr:hypothetical protein [Chloroflexota bacterium]